MSGARRWDTGLERPYRDPPADFRDRYLEMGWDGIDEHYRTNWRVIRRWIEDCGGDELRRARAELTGSVLRPHRRSERTKRYVLGRTLRRVEVRTHWPSVAPTFWDRGLVAAPVLELGRKSGLRISIDRAVRIVEAVSVEGRSIEFQAGVLAAVAALRAVEV
jgi:hypothetical protein